MAIMFKINPISSWQPSYIHNQINSAKTNTAQGFSYFLDGSLDNTEGIGAFTDLKEYLRKGTTNIDIGGGKFDSNTEYLRTHFQVQNTVYDPFNRSEQHNNKALFENGICGSLRCYHSATSMSVLNVINLPEARHEHIKLMFQMIQCGGVALFKVYHGDGSRIEKVTETGYQSNKSAEHYVEEIACVFGKSNTQLMPNGIPNLIVAFRVSSCYSNH
jgi:hypothetical protein